jgi:hypothetical protein
MGKDVCPFCGGCPQCCNEGYLVDPHNPENVIPCTNSYHDTKKKGLLPSSVTNIVDDLRQGGGYVPRDEFEGTLDAIAKIYGSRIAELTARVEQLEQQPFTMVLSNN